MDIESVKPFLNVFDIEQIIPQLRSYIEMEYKMLLEDIEFIRDKIETTNQDTSVSIPSVKEMKQIEYKLEMQVEQMQREEKLQKMLPSLPSNSLPPLQPSSSPRTLPPISTTPSSPSTGKSSSRLRQLVSQSRTK